MSVILSLNFIISLIYIFCPCCYCTQNTAIPSWAPYDLHAFHYAIQNETTHKFYLVWDRPVNFLSSNHISNANANAAKIPNDLLLHQLTFPIPEETQPNQSYQTTNNKPVLSAGNELENNTNSVDKGYSYKTPYKRVTNKIGLFGDVHEYIVEYKLKDSNEASTKIKVGKDVTWVCLQDLVSDSFYSIYVSAKYSTRTVQSAEYLLHTADTNANSTNDCSCYANGVNPGSENCDLNSSEICRCQEGYTGLFCDQCKHLFYEKDGHCIPCPCKSKSFYCSFYEDELVCFCKEGYKGKDCDICDNGYFRYYDKCAKCICNGNIDLNSPEICDPENGACKHCLYNTTGYACDHCLPGYTGDPIRHKNCTYEGFEYSNKSSSRKSSKLSASWIFLIALICVLAVFFVVVVYYRRICSKIRKTIQNNQKDDQGGVKFTDMNTQEFDESFNTACSSGFHLPGKQRGMQYSPLKEVV
ncbi:laminin subunit alpha-1-like [Argonauta hians]